MPQHDSHDELLGRLVQSLMESAEHPPSEVQGVSDEFIEQLDRVPKKSLKADMTCPICSNAFLDGKALIVSNKRSSVLTFIQTRILWWFDCRAIRITFSISNA